MDVWDIFFRQTAPALTHKVSDAGLSCVAASPQAGRLLACGDKRGAVHLLEVTSGGLLGRQGQQQAVLTRGSWACKRCSSHSPVCHRASLLSHVLRALDPRCLLSPCLIACVVLLRAAGERGAGGVAAGGAHFGGGAP